MSMYIYTYICTYIAARTASSVTGLYLLTLIDCYSLPSAQLLVRIAKRGWILNIHYSKYEDRENWCFLDTHNPFTIYLMNIYT